VIVSVLVVCWAASGSANRWGTTRAKPRTGWWTRLVARVQAIVNARAAAPLARNELLASPSQRPPCGDDPMLWKERYATMGGGLRWLGSRPVVLFFSVLLGCYLFDVAYPVLVDLFGARGRQGPGSAMKEALRDTSTALAFLGMLAVAASAAVSLTAEREQDTWVSLATTLLTPVEIIRAKQFAALWSARRIGAALLIFWAAGVFLGAIHPLGLLAAAGIVLICAWFIAAVGVFFSAHARNSTRALMLTFIALFLSLIWPWVPWRSPITDLRGAILWMNGGLAGSHPWIASLDVLIGLAYTAISFAAAAGILTWWSIRRLRANWGQV
jgi:hypothetical protein